MLVRFALIDSTPAYIAADKVLCIVPHLCGDDCDDNCHRAGGTDIELAETVVVTVACGLEDAATRIKEARNGLL